MPMKPGTRRKEYIKYSCAYCGKPGECAPSWAKGKAKLFCRGEGQDCKGKYQAAGKATLPKGSFMLRPDAARITEAVGALIQAGRNGGQIQKELGLTRGNLQGILKRNGWSIAFNAGRSAADGNVKKVREFSLPCPACGKTNFWKPWQLKGKLSKFCDAACAGKPSHLHKKSH